MTAQHQPIPSAGPYYITSSTPRPAGAGTQPELPRRPTAGPQRIVYSFDESCRRRSAGRAGPQRLRRAASDRRSDQSPDRARSCSRSSSATAEPARRHGPATSATSSTRALDLDYFVLNTARPRSPRRACAARSTTRSTARRSSQHHPLFTAARDRPLPGPGNTRLPSGRHLPAGGPDLAKARRAGRGVHTHATLVHLQRRTAVHRRRRIVQTDLAAIGITVDIVSLPTWTRRPACNDRRAMGHRLGELVVDFADPSRDHEHIRPLAAGATSATSTTPPSPDASASSDAHRCAPSRAYGRLDEELAGDDRRGRLGIGTFRDFFSARVGCQVYQPIYGMDLGRLCLRQ